MQPNENDLLFHLQYDDQKLQTYMNAARRSNAYEQIVNFLEKISIPIKQNDHKYITGGITQARKVTMS